MGFFSLLRECTRVPVACEPRHASWFTPAAASMLSNAGIACTCEQDPSASWIERAPDAASRHIRLHSAPRLSYSACDDGFIEAVAARMRLAHQQHRNVWRIFNNTARGEAVPNALMLFGQLAD